MKKEAIRVSTTIPAAPTTLYYAWLSQEQHGAMTGGTQAKIDPTVGAKFSALNGLVSGKLVILDLGRRLVMSWRSTEFPREANDSRVEMHLEALGGSTRITLIQTEIPEGLGEKTRSIWNDQYFGPMRAFFSKFLPDPRNPPPPRRPIPPPDDDDEEEEEKLPPKRALSSKGSGKPIIIKPVTAKPVTAKAAPPPPPPPKIEKKPAKPEKAPAKPAKPEKKPTPPPKKKKAAPPPPAKKKPAPPAKAKKPEKKPAKKAERKPAKKAEKPKPKKKK